MNGELAQLIALATHGTVWLGRPVGRAPKLDRTNTTFQYVRAVRFTIGGPLGTRRTQDDVSSWLESLARRGMRRLWLAVPSAADRGAGSHMLVGLAGGGTWSLLATFGDGGERWRADWQVGDRDAPDQRLWDVTYSGSRTRGSSDPRAPDLASAQERLASVLAEVRSFAHRHELSPWADSFTRGLDALQAEAPKPPYHPDMVSSEFPRPARRLAAAAAHAWVFAGMGSWNDLGFGTRADTEEYERLTRDLYNAVLTAFVASVNAEL